MYVDTKLADVGFELVRFMKLQDILWKQMDPAVTMLETATTLPSVNYQTKNSNIHRIGKKRNDPLSRIFLCRMILLIKHYMHVKYSFMNVFHL